MKDLGGASGGTASARPEGEEQVVKVVVEGSDRRSRLLLRCAMQALVRDDRDARLTVELGTTRIGLLDLSSVGLIAEVDRQRILGGIDPAEAVGAGRAGQVPVRPLPPEQHELPAALHSALRPHFFVIGGHG